MQFITHYTERYSYLDAARMALEGGCRWVQLRMKDTPVETIEPVALEVQALCRQYGATFIIDDHVELVKKLRADGVHLGKKDMPIADARRILGAEYIIGGTANTFEDVQQHYKAGADYIGCGPFRYTTTKKNLSPILGLEGYAAIVNRMREENVCLPMVAIGRNRHIIKLIGRIEPIFRTGDNIACHHIILTLKCPITNIGIRRAVFKQVIPSSVEETFCISGYCYLIGAYRIRRFRIQKATATTCRQKQSGNSSKYRLNFYLFHISCNFRKID